MAIRRTNQEWQTLFNQYENSNMTLRVFCEQKGLSSSTFFVNVNNSNALDNQWQRGL